MNKEEITENKYCEKGTNVILIVILAIHKNASRSIVLHLAKLWFADKFLKLMLSAFLSVSLKQHFLISDATGKLKLYAAMHATSRASSSLNRIQNNDFAQLSSKLHLIYFFSCRLKINKKLAEKYSKLVNRKD